jgi:hypothetical protein
MNPRVRYSQKYNKLVCHLDGSEFPYTPRNQESLAKSLAALSAHGMRVIEALEKHAGRALTDAELRMGVEHDDPRTLSQRIADQMPDQPAREGDPNVSPYAKAIEMGLAEPKKRESKLEMYERLDRTWRDKRQSEAEQNAFHADPQRRRAIAHAEQELKALRFDPLATVEEIELAETRLRVAQHESLDDYRQMDRQWRQLKQQKVDAATAEVTASIEALKAKRREIESRHFDPPAPPAPEQPQAPKYETILLSDPRHPQYREPETPIVVG